MFPHAEKLGASTVTLPLFTLLSHDDVTRVVRAVDEICDQHGTH
jgi:dTDP-4-amino-4,6-dideoxygalactose transaminase